MVPPFSRRKALFLWPGLKHMRYPHPTVVKLELSQSSAHSINKSMAISFFARSTYQDFSTSDEIVVTHGYRFSEIDLMLLGTCHA